MSTSAPSTATPPPTANLAEPPFPGQTITPWLAVVLAVVLIAGLLFGYDQGVISGALHGIEREFDLGALMIGVVTSWVTLGALFGSLIGGEVADRLGRKRTILLAGLMFVAGALVQALAPLTIILVAGRLIVGAGVGVAAVAAPLYAAELAPATLRGRFVSAYQLAITIGIFLAYLVNGWLDDWRMMLGVSAVPGLMLLVAALVAPESPRWLMRMHRRADAAIEMKKVRPGVDVEPRLNSIEQSLRRETQQAPWGELFHREWRRPLTVAVGLAIFQQVTGINAIIYYANHIFAAAGFASAAAQTTATTWAIGGVNVAATLIAIAFIDGWGRRKLLLAGLAGMGGSLLVVGTAFNFIPPPDAMTPDAGPTAAGIVTLLALVVFIISFAFSLGPVVWTVINEVFPGRVRGRGVAFATAVNWGSAFLVSQWFLSLVDAIGNALTFWLFAFFCALGWVWIYYMVPETKGQSLEQIETMWKEPAG